MTLVSGSTFSAFHVSGCPTWGTSFPLDGMERETNRTWTNVRRMFIFFPPESPRLCGRWQSCRRRQNSFSKHVAATCATVKQLDEPGLDPGAALHYRLKGGIRKDSQTLILTAPPHLDLQVLWAFGKTASPAGHQKGGPRALWTDLSETVQQSNGRKPRFGSPRISEDLSL